MAKIVSDSWSLIALDTQASDIKLSAHRWYAAVRHLPMPVMLESFGSPGSRYDIITAMPVCRLFSKKDHSHKNKLFIQEGYDCEQLTEMELKEEERADTQPFSFLDRHDPFSDSVLDRHDPFSILDRHVKKYRPACVQPIEDVFCGGALGYISYDLGLGTHGISSRTGSPGIKVPDLIWGIYEWSIVVDHLQGQTWLVISPDMALAQREVLLNTLRQPEDRARSGKAEFKPLSLPQASFDYGNYLQAFEKIKDYIEEGDCYQVNLARRFSAKYEGDPFCFYESVVSKHQSPFSAYMDLGEVKILSFSPERFLRVENREVTTQPIKGTRPRGKSPAEDLRLSAELKECEKDLAENLMIVDLLRNDLGKCCVPGSISVPQLRQLETFDNVHHLVSTVTGTLREDATPMDLMQGCFPGGSITGAPKKRAMQIIEELELDNRSVYCGTIGYYAFNGLLESNIAIRTLLCSENELFFWGGGGIVSESEAEKEYQESQDKIDFIYTELVAALSMKERSSA